MSAPELQHDRLATALRLVAALAWLTLALALFRGPLELVLRPVARATGVDALLFPPAPGFLLRAASSPPGGTLSIDGVEIGRLPLFTNVACRDGQTVLLVVEKEGFAPWEREVPCRPEQSLMVRARLGK